MGGNRSEYEDAAEACFGSTDVVALGFFLAVGLVVSLVIGLAVAFLGSFHIWLWRNNMTTWTYIQSKKAENNEPQDPETNGLVQQHHETDGSSDSSPSEEDANAGESPDEAADPINVELEPQEDPQQLEQNGSPDHSSGSHSKSDSNSASGSNYI
jgi:cytoskeletal protein RodZ